jgi:hypothetical protein
MKWAGQIKCYIVLSYSIDIMIMASCIDTRLVYMDTVGHDNDTHVLEVFSIYVFIEKLLKTSF